jgi:predicted esterase
VRVLYIHGLESGPLGNKARFLAARFDTLTPQMDTSDLAACIEVQTTAIASFAPDVVVGSSFGGGVAVALLIAGAWRGPTVLLAHAARKMRVGGEPHIPAGTPVVLVHGTRDDIIPVEDSRLLAATGSPELVRLIEVDDDHRLTAFTESGRLAEVVEQALHLTEKRE